MKENYFIWRITPTWCAHVFKAIFKKHHREMTPILKKFIPADGVVLDVGAHAGQFAKMFSEIASNGMVVSIEPGSYARSILRFALLFNRCTNVVVVPCALGSNSDVEILHLPEKRKGSFGFGLSHIAGQKNDLSERFKIVSDVVVSARLDDIAVKMNFERLDFIKADIEGWELRMIKGGLETIKRFSPVIYLELVEHSLARAGDSVNDAWETLTGLGYDPFILNETTMSLAPLNTVTEGDIWWLSKK